MRQPTGAARTAGRDSSVRTGGMPCAAWPRRYGHRFDTWTNTEILRAERLCLWVSGFVRRVGGSVCAIHKIRSSTLYTRRVIGLIGVWAGAAPAGARGSETGDETPSPKPEALSVVRLRSHPPVDASTGRRFWTRHSLVPHPPRQELPVIPEPHPQPHGMTPPSIHPVWR
jgi:hypothetical protein